MYDEELNQIKFFGLNKTFLLSESFQDFKKIFLIELDRKKNVFIDGNNYIQFKDSLNIGFNNIVEGKLYQDYGEYIISS